jgi:carbonic anhydrase/acetyltransferase-like protein (isoleucine patch superfamily)
MGAIIMNNAVIGSNSIVGAGALVTENTKIEPGQLVIGSPAKPVKPTSQAMIDGIQRSAEGYVQKIPQFRALTFVSPIILDQEPTKDV